MVAGAVRAAGGDVGAGYPARAGHLQGDHGLRHQGHTGHLLQEPQGLVHLQVCSSNCTLTFSFLFLLFHCSEFYFATIYS